MDGPAALRALARAFAHLGDFDRFVAGLQTALERSVLFENTTLALDRGLVEGSISFPPGVMSLPIAGGTQQFGTLQATPGGENRQFGAEDLHLLAGLADFLSAALTASAQAQAAGQSRELMRFLLNQAPVGIAAYGPDRQPIVANELARRWLGEASLPFDDLEKGAASFHLRAGGKLIYGEARRVGLAVEGAWMVVLHDLTPDQARLLDLMRRETYRALAQRGKFGFALVEGADMRQGVLRRLPELRAALMLGETTGPYDAHRVGLVFSEVNGLALRARLRKLRHVFAGVEGLRVGYAELGRNGATPEALLEAALHLSSPYDDSVRPSVLVHDENPAVTGTLALLLGRDFNVVQSSESGRTRELLGREMFEGFVAELESRTGPDGAELMKYARAQLPGIRPFFLTARHATQDWPAETAKEDTVVFEKPFDVAAVTQALRDKLAD
jgi:PAS domain-containing protein/CheY-like chemotaxis protein